MLVDNYDALLNGVVPDGIRIADMSKGKAKDDGYRGGHIYFQPDHYYYPIEIQSNTYYDKQLNNWLHKYRYKREFADSVGRRLCQKYECGKMIKEQDFEDVEA